MKTQILKHKFIYFFMLLGLAVSFNACSDDDEPETFLEKYDGTVWATDNIDSDNDSFLRIVNNLKTLSESWRFDESDDCYEYSFLGVLNPTIIENSTDKLVVEINDAIIIGDTSISFTYTFVVEGETLTSTIAFDGTTETITEIYNKTSVNVDNFDVCEN